MEEPRDIADAVEFNSAKEANAYFQDQLRREEQQQKELEDARETQKYVLPQPCATAASSNDTSKANSDIGYIQVLVAAVSPQVVSAQQQPAEVNEPKPDEQEHGSPATTSPAAGTMDQQQVVVSTTFVDLRKHHQMELFFSDEERSRWFIDRERLLFVSSFLQFGAEHISALIQRSKTSNEKMELLNKASESDTIEVAAENVVSRVGEAIPLADSRTAAAGTGKHRKTKSALPSSRVATPLTSSLESPSSTSSRRNVNVHVNTSSLMAETQQSSSRSIPPSVTHPDTSSSCVSSRNALKSHVPSSPSNSDRSRFFSHTLFHGQRGRHSRSSQTSTTASEQGLQLNVLFDEGLSEDDPPSYYPPPPRS